MIYSTSHKRAYQMRSKNFKFVFGAFVVIAGALAFIFFPQGWVVKGRGGGSQLIIIAILPMIIAYTICFLYVLRKKRKEILILSKLLAKKDPAWDLQPISQRIEITFFFLQKSLQEEDLSFVRPFVSDRLFSDLNRQLLQEKKAPQLLVREGVVLRKYSVVNIADYEENSKDSLCVTVSYRMNKYIVDRETRRPITKKTWFKQACYELWVLVYHPEKGWILDIRHESVKLSQLLCFQSFSESYPEQSEDLINMDIGKAIADYEWILQKYNTYPEYPSINSPIVALMIGLVAPWAIVLIIYLRILYNGGFQ